MEKSKLKFLQIMNQKNFLFMFKIMALKFLYQILRKSLADLFKVMSCLQKKIKELELDYSCVNPL